MYRSPQGNYFIYSVNTWREGLWVIELVPNAQGELAPPAAQPQGTWLVPVVSSPQTLGHCHNIDVDPVQGRAAIYVTDDHNLQVVKLDLSNPMSPGAGGVQVVASGVAFHDAMVYHDHLWVSSVGLGSPFNIPPDTRVFELPFSDESPTPVLVLPASQAPVASMVPCGHSAYVDVLTPFVEGRLYTLAEDDVPALFKRNMSVFGIDITNLAGAMDEGYQALRTIVPYVLPTGVQAFGSPPPPTAELAPVHNLRGIRRTGFVAMYRDGLGLVDLFHDETGTIFSTDPGFYGNQTLGSFDTTVRQHHVPIPPPGYPSTAPSFAPYATVSYWTGATPHPLGLPAPGLWDKFLGAWDVAVHQDSGLVHVPLGPNLVPGASPQERLLTAGVFRVREGHLNRYWDATPFPATSPNQALGLVPRLIALQGPPRQGKGFLLGDENAGKYAQQTAQGLPLKYEYTLIYAPSAPVGAGGSNPATAATPLPWDPDPSSSTNNLVWLNVWDPTMILGAQWVRRQGPGPAQDAAAGWFYFPTLGNQGQRWYCQILVEEYVETGTPPVASRTGRFAASRGHWFGVARP